VGTVAINQRECHMSDETRSQQDETDDELRPSQLDDEGAEVEGHARPRPRNEDEDAEVEGHARPRP
jgi:hypothetical protein